MTLFLGRFWKVSLAKSGEEVALAVQRDGLGPEAAELRDFRIDVPLARWNAFVKHRVSDRKLFGGLLLEFAQQKDLVAAVVGHDRLLHELRRAIAEASLALVEAERLALAPVEREDR